VVERGHKGPQGVTMYIVHTRRSHSLGDLCRTYNGGAKGGMMAASRG
jgi:hypothetical protein